MYCAGKEIGMLGKFCIAVQISVLVDEIPKFLLVVSAAICFMLEDWRGMDKEKAKEYIINCQVCIEMHFSWGSILHSFLILSSYGYECKCTYIPIMLFFQSYDGGFGLIPGSESHGECEEILCNCWFMFSQTCPSWGSNLYFAAS